MQGPFSYLVDRHVTDPWLKSLLDLECFVLSGMVAKDTSCAEMVRGDAPMSKVLQELF